MEGLTATLIMQKETEMLPEAKEAIRIADKHLAGKSVERRKALAMDIIQAMAAHATKTATEAVAAALDAAKIIGVDDADAARH